MTIEYDEGDHRMSVDIVNDDTPMMEQSQEEYESWYDGHFFYNAYHNAAEALRDEASRAFVRGRDEIAFLLRERANELEDYGTRESSDWEKGHRSK